MIHIAGFLLEFNKTPY